MGHVSMAEDVSPTEWNTDAEIPRSDHVAPHDIDAGVSSAAHLCSFHIMGAQFGHYFFAGATQRQLALCFRFTVRSILYRSTFRSPANWTNDACSCYFPSRQNPPLPRPFTAFSSSLRCFQGFSNNSTVSKQSRQKASSFCCAKRL